jgi:hypothetical protein
MYGFQQEPAALHTVVHIGTFKVREVVVTLTYILAGVREAEKSRFQVFRKTTC